MTSKLYTARYHYRGVDRFDITNTGIKKYRGSSTSMAPGVPFAPSDRILYPMLQKRKTVGISQSDWETYRQAYLQEMHQSQKTYPDAWQALIARPLTTLVCFCSNATQCHRVVLAELLQSLGVEYLGER